MSRQAPLRIDLADHERSIAEPCVVCHKPIKDPRQGRMIEVAWYGDLIREGDPRSNGSDSQGCFPIGPECWRKVRVSGKVWGS